MLMFTRLGLPLLAHLDSFGLASFLVTWLRESTADSAPILAITSCRALITHALIRLGTKYAVMLPLKDLGDNGERRKRKVT